MTTVSVTDRTRPSCPLTVSLDTVTTVLAAGVAEQGEQLLSIDAGRGAVPCSPKFRV